tara:strand:+ start:2034 stop:2240 length:207 start_codon:yes stop_codon:yes gene_type:complete
MTKIIKKEIINKVFKVIRSCETPEQLRGAKRYVNLFLMSRRIPKSEPLAKRLVQQLNLMKIKMRMKHV